MAKYEVEIRGKLTKKQFSKLKSFLDKNAIIGKKQNQIALFLDGNFDKKIGSIANSKMRFAIQINNGQTNLKVKHGHVSLTGRKEIELNLGNTFLSDIFSFLQIFGFQKSAVRPVYRQDYHYTVIDIALKNKCLFGDHFEFEIKVNKKSDLENATKKLYDFAEKFKLDILSEKEYLNIILDIYKKFPPIEFSKILQKYNLK